MRYEFGGLTFGGAYFRNFTVCAAQRVGFLRRFGLKTFSFWSGIGYGFQGNYGRIRTYLFEFEMDFKKSVLLLF